MLPIKSENACHGCKWKRQALNLELFCPYLVFKGVFCRLNYVSRYPLNQLGYDAYSSALPSNHIYRHMCDRSHSLLQIRQFFSALIPSFNNTDGGLNGL